jgi:hypothetical protein
MNREGAPAHVGLEFTFGAAVVPGAWHVFLVWTLPAGAPGTQNIPREHACTGHGSGQAVAAPSARGLAWYPYARGAGLQGLTLYHRIFGYAAPWTMAVQRSVSHAGLGPMQRAAQHTRPTDW